MEASETIETEETSTAAEEEELEETTTTTTPTDSENYEVDIYILPNPVITKGDNFQWDSKILLYQDVINDITEKQFGKLLKIGIQIDGIIKEIETQFITNPHPLSVSTQIKLEGKTALGGYIYCMIEREG